MRAYYTCNLTPLRIFMGLQMIGWGVVLWSSPWSVTHARLEQNWLWAMTILISGAWVTLSAGAEVYVRTYWPRKWTNKQRRSYRVLSKATVAGYFFSGAAWGGIGLHLMQQKTFGGVDILCPLYMGFLLYLAFKDATVKRKGVVLRNETKQRQLELLAHGFDARSAVRAERSGC